MTWAPRALPVIITWGNAYSQCKSQHRLGASLWSGEDVCSHAVQSYGQLSAGDTGWELQIGRNRVWGGTQEWVHRSGRRWLWGGRGEEWAGGLPPCNLAYKGAEAGNRALLPCPFLQILSTTFSAHYTVKAVDTVLRDNVDLHPLNTMW